jgi:hypothetical protein
LCRQEDVHNRKIDPLQPLLRNNMRAPADQPRSSCRCPLKTPTTTKLDLKNLSLSSARLTFTSVWVKNEKSSG